MANKNLCIFILIATIVAQATWVRATDYEVGDCKHWNQGVDYKAWASGKQFYLGDNLLFKYEEGKHDIVFVYSQAAFDNCDATGGKFMPSCGNNVVTLTKVGDFYIISSIGDDCAKGMKFIGNVKPSPAIE